MSKLSIDTKTDEIVMSGNRWPLAGAHAEVTTTGAVSSRFTLTRFLLLGPFALAFKKSKDNRTVWLTVTTTKGEQRVALSGNAEREAHAFAARVNSAAIALEHDVEARGDFR